MADQASHIDQLDPALAAHLERRRAAVHDELVRRVMLATRAQASDAAKAVVLEMCARDPAVLFDDWLWTYDPRNADLSLPVSMPFTLRPTQRRLIRWLQERERTMTSGLIEKSRDEGMSFIVLGYMLHHWLFVDGFAGAVGSRKQDLVDRIGDPKCLFEKVRFMLYSLPDWFLPKGFKVKEHDNFLRLLNPATGATITGEAGDDMGRGGRATLYFVDEWAFVDHAEKVNAAISQNSNVRIKGSTPNGVGNLMYQERFSGKFPVFTMHWRDNPDKNFTATRTNAKGEEEEYYPWYEKQEAELDPVTLAQEVDIDYTASAEGIVIPAKWVQAAIGLKLKAGTIRKSGLDVSEDGGDKTIYTHRRGGVVVRVREVTGSPRSKAQKVEEMCREDGADVLHYDRLGVGAAVTATLAGKENLPFRVVGVANSESPTNTRYDDQPKVPAGERFANRAAEMWWSLRLRFWRTYQRVTGEKDYPDDECISIPNDPALIAQLAQPTYSKNSKDKIVVDKKGTGAASPDRAESLMYAYAVEDGPPVSSNQFKTISL